MTHRSLKIGTTGVALVAAFTALLWSTLRDDVAYYKHVDEVMSSPRQWQGKWLQIHGFVVPKSIVRVRDTSGSITLDYVFKLQTNGSILEATYSGIVPDTFKDDSEVVLKGRLQGATFRTDPNGVMAKCPSKYEAARRSVTGGPGSGGL